MGTFTFVWQWIVMDVIVYLLAVILIVFIVKKEKHPAAILLEFICFVLLNAAVYENFATLMGWYGYGRSLIMIFNVPASVPVMEYIVVYAALRLADAMKIKAWMKPLFVGVFGMLTDFSLDPLAVSQRFATLEGTTGRWTWYPALGDVQIFDIPIYNFTGWILLCGYSTVFLLLGRWFFRKMGEMNWAGFLYPPVSMILALGVMVSPLSSFLLWLGPLFSKGGFSEIVMISLFPGAFAGILLFGWKGRMTGRLSLRQDYVIPVSFAVFHLANLLFTVIGGYWNILILTVPMAAIHLAILWFIWKKGCRFVPLSPVSSANARIEK
jgi:hypothetical protein